VGDEITETNIVASALNIHTTAATRAEAAHTAAASPGASP
jgi:hypothetical protein